jgi:hypothetical protein
VETSSHGVVTSKESNNNPGLRPAKRQKSGFYSRTGEPATWFLLSCTIHVFPVTTLIIEYFQCSLTYFVFCVGCCFMLRSVTVLPVSVSLPCFRYMSRACRDIYVVNGEILYFLYFRHKSGNIVFPLFNFCRAW